MIEGLIDSHCHLMMDQFRDDLGQVLDRAQTAGVAVVLVPGIDLESSRAAVELAESHASLFAAVGIHPHDARSWSRSIADEIRRLASSNRVVAIGEIGLDFYRDFSPRDEQTQAFRAQLELAAELHLPVIIHNRDATDEILEELERWTSTLAADLQSRPGVLHAFSGDAASADRALAIGFYLGVGGPITFRNAADLRGRTSALPLDRLLVETDAPYLSPHPHRGERNEPAYLPLVADGLARALDLQIAEVARATTRNANRLFQWNNGTDNSDLL